MTIGGVSFTLPSIALLRRVVEERRQLVELALRERVELVIVAHRAAGRQAHPHLRRRLRAVARVEHGVLFVDRAAFAGRDVAAVEAGADLLLERRVRQQVAGQVFDRELIERHVRVERLDHPIAVRPHLAEVVDVDAVRVGVAGRVEPVPAAMLAPLAATPAACRPAARRRPATASLTNSSTSSGVGGRPVRSRLNRRASVRRSASGAGVKPGGFQPRRDETVDRIADPPRILQPSGRPAAPAESATNAADTRPLRESSGRAAASARR